MPSWLPGMMQLAERCGLDELCWLLYASVEATVADLHDLETWGAMTPSAMAAARRVGGEGLARTLLVAGAWNRLSGRPRDAEELFTEAIRAYTILGDHRLLAAAMNRRGAARMNFRDLTGAAADFQTVIELAHGADPVMEGLAHMNRCALALKQGDFAGAVEAGLAADTILTGAEADLAWHLETALQMIEAYSGLGDLHKAEHYADRTNSLIADGRPVTIVIGAHIAIGQLRLAQQRNPEALDHFAQARRLAADASPWRIPDIDEGTARALDAEQAVPLLQQTLTARRSAGVDLATARTLSYLADVLVGAGREGEARQCQAEALELLSALDDPAAAPMRAALNSDTN
jgi:tetratricopeptide (TPR) repeat protein